MLQAFVSIVSVEIRKCLLLFLMFHQFCATYVESAFIWMLHMFSHIWCKFFFLDVAYVYNGFKCFSGVFASILNTWFKCFICFQKYVASRCFKTRSSVASPSSLFCCLVSVSGAGGPHVLAGGRSKRDVGRQAQDARRGQWRGRPNGG
jgi:hypothetical protein